MSLCSIIILNFDGKDLLSECLPSVIEAVRHAGGDHEIMVVDNGSTDDSVEFVRRNFPTVRVLPLDRNYRFVGGNNRGIREAKHDIVVLLNNDMVVDRNFLNPLLKGFEDPSVFAVTSQIFFQDKGKRREETGKTGFFWDRGMLYPFHQYIDDADVERNYVPIVWAGGGSAAYDRKKFMALGMFDTLYLPCYVDDLDISYMAWKRGWKSLLCAESIVHHKHRATHVRQFTTDQLDVIIQRHQLLFLWKNLTSFRMLLSHLTLLPLHILKQMKREGKSILLRGFLSGLARIPRVVAARLARRPGPSVTDAMIFRNHYIKKSVGYAGAKLTILFVCPYVPCLGVHAGGGRMYKIVEGLSARHRVHVLTYTEGEQDEQYVRQLETVCERVVPIVRGQSLNEPDWFHITPHRPVKEFANPRMKLAIAEELQSGRYDIVQFEYLDMGYLAYDARKFDVPMILTNHEVQTRTIRQAIKEDHSSFVDKLQLWFDWMKMLTFEIRTARLFDRVITLTDAERQSLIEYAPDLPIEVHATGVDVPYFSSDHPVVKEPHAMVFVGYYRHYPNEDAMMYFCSEILPLVRRECPDAKIYVVGAEPLRDLRRLHDGTSVIVTGRVDDIRPYIARAAVYVVPIRLGAGIRGKILEAWAMKKPVIATPIAASGLAAEDGRNIVLADTAHDFARQILRLFREPRVGDRLGEAGYQIACSMYDWPAKVKEHEMLYYQLLDGDRS